MRRRKQWEHGEGATEEGFCKIGLYQDPLNGEPIFFLVARASMDMPGVEIFLAQVERMLEIMKQGQER